MLNEQTPLPDGWIYVSLDDALATLESGARPKGGVKKILVGVPSIGAEHLDGKGGFNFKNIRFIPAEFYKRLNRGIIKPLDVLVVKDGATTGKTSIVTSDFPFKESNVNEHVFILRPINQLLEPQYLFRFLSSNQGNRQILEKFQGSAQGGINSQFVKNFPIPLPPINEQKRIIAKIEALFAESKTARDALGKIPTLLQNLRQSIVAEAFRGELTYQESNFQFAKDSYEEHYINQNDDLPSIPKQWRWVTIGQLLCEGKGGIRTGPFGTLLKKSDFRKEGVYLIGIQNLGKDEFVWKDMEFISEAKAQDLSGYKLQPNDIAISRSGTIDRACVIPTKLTYSIMSSNLMRISLNITMYIPELFSKFVNYSNLFSNQAEKLCKGTTRKFLNKKILCSIAIPKPPIDEQRRIVAKIDSLFLTITNIERAFEKTKSQTNLIDKTILAKAFRGELVPQDPNDEPASVLLQRIKNVA